MYRKSLHEKLHGPLHCAWESIVYGSALTYSEGSQVDFLVFAIVCSCALHSFVLVLLKATRCLIMQWLPYLRIDSLSDLVKCEYSKLSLSGVVSYVFPCIVSGIFVLIGPLLET